MSDAVKVVLIFSATCIVCLSMWIFFSPFQTCVRAAKGDDMDTYGAVLGCIQLATKTSSK